MFRLLLLTVVAHYSYANCGKHLSGQVYAPCPPKVQPPAVYAAPPPPPPPVVFRQVLLPELAAPHELLRQRHRRSRHRYRSSSDSREYRNRRRGRTSCGKSRCPPLIPTCAPNTNCTVPVVKYIKDTASCERAIVTCYLNTITQTPDLKVLSTGVGIDNMLTCDKWGRWIAKDSQNQKVVVTSLGCYPPTSEEEDVEEETDR